MSAGPAITQMLTALRLGDKGAEAELVRMVYPELHRMAGRFMRREAAGDTLQATALVNEAYLRLAGPGEHPWQNRAHFYAVAGRVMRQILVDRARARRARKRGAGAVHLDVDEVRIACEEDFDNTLALDEALTRLAARDERQCRVVELRYFVGLTEAEIAEVLQISLRSVKRDWRFARAWLYGELTGTHKPKASP